MIASQLRHGQCDGGRRDEAACQPRQHHAALGAGHAAGDISGKGELISLGGGKIASVRVSSFSP
jgi:hypothetical protein